MNHEMTITRLAAPRGEQQLHCTCTPTGTLFTGSYERCEDNMVQHRKDIQRDAAARLGVGRKVRHANSKLDTWRGEVAPCPRGSKKGAWKDDVGGFTYVFVRWTVPGLMTSPSWYSADAVLLDEAAAGQA